VIMNKLAVLKKTEEYVDHSKTNIREQIEDILDDAENLYFKNYSDEKNMMETIFEILNKPTVAVTATNIYETKDYMFVGYFIDASEYTVDTNQFNYFSSQISSHQVVSDMIVVKKKLEYQIDRNNIKTISTPVNFTQYELANVFEKIFVKDGVTISVDGSMTTYQYIVNPLEHLMLTDNKYEEHYRYHEYEVYTRVMVCVVDIRENNGTINETASLLIGIPVKGSVHVGMYQKPEYKEDPPYVSVSPEIIQQILKVRRVSPTLTSGHSNSSKEYINFYNLLALESQKYTDTPSRNVKDMKEQPLNLLV